MFRVRRIYDDILPTNREAIAQLQEILRSPWPLRANDFLENGRLVDSLKLPTLLVQEGGYDTAAIGVNARNFFSGLWKGAFTVASRIAA